MCTSIKKILVSLVVITSSPLIMAEPTNESDLEEVGMIQAAPEGKYTNSAESTTYDQPAFIDSSSPSGGNAADIPIAPYVIIGVDFDQQGSIKGSDNGGTVPFTDNGAYFTVGMDKRISDSWIIGGYIKQKGSFVVQQNDASNPNNNGYLPSAASTELRLQAGYTTNYGLANIVRLDALSGAYGAPGLEFTPALRVENFTRYDTQYNKTFYQFAGQRLRYRTDGGWDTRWFLGQGFQFNDYNTYEVSFIQDFAQAGEVNGLPLYINNNGSQFLAGIISKQLITNSYTHVFTNKTSLSLNANWVGSTYYTGNYQSGFEVEASFRIPF
ncbi:MAG: hypothetical protein EKK57_02950 [Proteobacteria bacterium]|nr:MAG: hypothetical protein EKK57_02950 [Pseudomonadota bacterium]